MRTASRRGASIVVATATIGALTFGSLSAASAETLDDETIPVAVVDTTRPVVVVDAPASGAVTRGDLTVTVTGSDDTQLTTLAANLHGPAGFIRPIGNAGAGPFDTPTTRTWMLSTSDLPEGSYSVRAGARDAAGNNGTTAVPFTVDRTRPTVAITSPVTGLVTRDAVTVTVEGADTVGLSRLVANLYDASNTTFLGPIGSTPANGSLGGASAATWTIPAGLADGTYTIRASATDLAGNVQVTTVRFTADRTRPSLEIVSPLSGSVFRDGIAVTVRGSDLNGLTRLTANLYDAGNAAFLGPIGTTGTDLPADSTPASRTWTIPAGLAEGTYTIRAGARDAAGNVQTVTATFTVDRTRPSIVIAQPFAGSLQNGPFDVTVTGTDGVGVQRLAANLYDATNTTFLGPIGSTSAATPLGGLEQSATWAFPSGLADGVYTIRAGATDLAGNVITTTTQVTLDTTAPALAITSPAPATSLTGSVSIEGTTADGLTGIVNGEVIVEVREYDAEADVCGPIVTSGPADVNEGAWQFVVVDGVLAPGDYCIAVGAADGAGNVSAAGPIAFTIAEPSPVEEILEQIADGVVAGPLAAVAALFTPASAPVEEGTPPATQPVSSTDDEVQLQTEALPESGAPADGGPAAWVVGVLALLAGLAALGVLGIRRLIAVR